MATLTRQQKAKLRAAILGGAAPGAFLKSDFDTATQEVEDALPAAFVGLKAAITNPALTSAMRNKVVKAVIVARVVALLGD